MRDVIWTIIAIWAVYQVFKMIRSSRVYVFQKHEHYQNTSREGEVKVDQKSQVSSRRPNSDKGGEYVEFEEIKE